MEPVHASQPAPDASEHHGKDWIPFVVAGVGLLISLVAAVWVGRETRARNHLRFESEVERARTSIGRRMDLYIASLRSGAGLFAASDSVSAREFAAYVSRIDLKRQYPGIQGIGFSRRMTAQGRPVVEAFAQQEYQRPFKVWPEQPPRNEYHAILFLEPRDPPNLAAIGYDMFTEPVRREAMERARDEGRAAASGKVTLVQEIDPAKRQAGLLIYVPVYEGGDVPATLEARRDKLLGFIYSPFRAGDLLEGIFGDLHGVVDIEVYDGASAQASSLLFHRHQPHSGDALEETRQLVVAGRPWTIVFRSRPGFADGRGGGVAWWVFAAGAAVSLLLFVLTHAESRARHRAERAVRLLETSRAQALRTLAELREIEGARRQLLISEQEARREAENANRVKDEFLATVSHELRTPLTAILGWAQMLNEQALDESGKTEAVEAIERNARAQAQLIEDLLDLSRIIRGKISLERKIVYLHEVIDAAITSVAPSANAKKLTVRQKLDANVQPVLGDCTRLQQVIWNLLSNSIKFTPSQGTVEVTLEQAGTSAIVRVADSGVGISATFLPHVFDQFRQADASTTRGQGGLGLGLAIVRTLVELHGGTVSAASEGEGRGATFTVTLPVATEVHAPAPVHPAHPPASLRGLRILVVDDEPDSRRLLARVLQRGGASVNTAESAAQALEVLDREPHDVLLSDISMPREDGYSLIRKVRARGDAQAAIPAAALTAFARSEDAERSLQAGFNRHINKPIDARHLIEAVAELAAQNGDKGEPSHEFSA